MGFGIEPKDTHKSNLNSLCISPFSIHRIVQLDCLRISAVNYSVVCNKQMTIIHVAEQKPIRIFFFAWAVPSLLTMLNYSHIKNNTIHVYFRWAFLVSFLVSLSIHSTYSRTVSPFVLFRFMFLVFITFNTQSSYKTINHWNIIICALAVWKTKASTRCPFVFTG